MTSPAAAPALRLRGVRVNYGTRTALQDVDLEVPRAQFLALTGPNGSGKSTLLRACLGLLAPSTGSVELMGLEISELSIRDRAHRVAWVPQDEPLRENVPLGRYVLYGRYAAHGALGREDARDRALAAAALQEVGLADRAEDNILSLSGGERQRAVLARALSQDAPLILLDEPTTHLDIGHQLDLLARVRTLVREQRLTVVAALHDLKLAARFADRIVVLSRGRLVADGPPAAVLSVRMLREVWGVAADLKLDGRTGAPYLVPTLPSDLASRPATAGAPSGRVHVVGGGGSAAGLLRAFADAGFEVSLGVVSLFDTDREVAEELHIPSVVEVPFAPVSLSARAQHRTVMAETRAVVVAPFPVGPGNLSNLEDVREVVGRIPVILLEPPDSLARDFTDGGFATAMEQIRRGGAVSVPTIQAALSAVTAALEAGRLRPSPAGPP